jgi:purine nucleosidase
MSPSVLLSLVCVLGALVGSDAGFFVAAKAASCVDEEPRFTQCPVEEAGAAWGAVDLSSYKAQWDAARSSVPALTAMCENGSAKYPCRASGALDWEGKEGISAPKRVVIDTDMANEVDDYPAVVWALLSSLGPSRQLTVLSVIAAPFSFRSRFMPVHRAAELQEQEGDLEAKPLSSAEKNYLKGKQDQLWRLKEAGTTTNRMIERDNHATWCPRKAMEESFEATVALVALFSKAKAVGISPRVAELAKTKVFKGQDRYVTWSKLGHLKAGLLASEGVADLIKRAQESTVDDPLFVLSLAAVTNVATALLLAPQIVGKIVVVWDASWSLNNRDKVQGTFNFAQDPLAVRVLLESGVRMLYFPGLPNGEALQLSFPDVNAWFKGQGAVSDAIFQRYINNPDLQWTGQGVSRYNNAGTTRIMWDSGNFIPFILPSLLSVQHVAPPSVVQVRTVEGTCDGYVSLGTCKAYFPGTDETYACESLDPYNLTQCIDAFFVNNPQAEARPLVEATFVGGLFKQGQGATVDLLRKLQAAGL